MGFLHQFKSLLRGGKVDVAERFELLRAAISGTMSKFYMARDRQTDRVVGLKLLDPQKTAAFEARFKGLGKPSEGEILQQLAHPRIVKLYEHGLTTKNEPYLVMEFVEGPGLNSLVVGRSKQLDGQRVPLIRQAAEALAYLHKAGFIHRDVCSRNFIAAPDCQSLKLIDFGLTVPRTAAFQQPGNRTGTPNYMAPELVRRLKTDHRLDIFSFGVTAYELCTFEHPWEKGADGRIAIHRSNIPPADIRKYRPTTDPRLADAIHKCIEQDPQQRTGSLEEFLAAIADVEHEDVR